MVTVKQHEEVNSLPIDGTASKCPWFSLQGIKVPIYRFGSQTLIDNKPFRGLLCIAEEEESILDSLLLSQWEDRMWRGCFRFDITTSEIKVIGGWKKFLAQLNEAWTTDDVPKFEENLVCDQGDSSACDWMKHHEELLVCVTHGEKENAELIPSAAVPNGAILIVINTTPVEYGHVFLVPSGPKRLHRSLDASSLEMFARLAVEINNCSFRMFYDSSKCASHPYFQACYFSNPLAVELMSVHTLFGYGKRGIHISAVLDYPIKTLLFKSNENFKILVESLGEICYHLQGKNMPYNMLISDRGKKIFMFFQQQTLENSCNLSAWECGGYFLFKSRYEFDQATEEAMLQRLSAVSLDDEGFQLVKKLCCSVASKFAI